jgi:hypothetical protein
VSNASEALPRSDVRDRLRNTDPEDRLLVGRRIALFGKILSGINFLFFVGFQLHWSGEPGVGAGRAWSATLSGASVFVQLT